jgi:valyl-tRNA synthetase
MALRLLHPVMPFLTEELWQRLATGIEHRPVSIAIAHYPQYTPDISDARAEYDMTVLQAIVTAARELRSDLKADPKQALDGVLIVREGARALAQSQLHVIERLSRMKLEVRTQAGEPVEGARRSQPEFDLIARVSADQADAQRGRLQKEIEQLEKVIASSNRQLGDEKFVSRAPAHVVEGIRAKLTEYEAQLSKNRAALSAPQP